MVLRTCTLTLKHMFIASLLWEENLYFHLGFNLSRGTHTCDQYWDIDNFLFTQTLIEHVTMQI